MSTGKDKTHEAFCSLSMALTRSFAARGWPYGIILAELVEAAVVSVFEDFRGGLSHARAEMDEKLAKRVFGVYLACAVRVFERSWVVDMLQQRWPDYASKQLWNALFEGLPSARGTATRIAKSERSGGHLGGVLANSLCEIAAQATGERWSGDSGALLTLPMVFLVRVAQKLEEIWRCLQEHAV